MLGLGLMSTHELGAYGWRWLTIDVTWAVVVGLGVGTLCGAGILDALYTAGRATAAVVQARHRPHRAIPQYGRC
jgi:hypothetical protein